MTTRIVVRHARPPTTYANFTQMHYLQEEVYLDFCTIDIDVVSPQQVQADGSLSEIPATPVQRIVLTIAHAERLAEALKVGLDRFAIEKKKASER